MKLSKAGQKATTYHKSINPSSKNRVKKKDGKSIAD